MLVWLSEKSNHKTYKTMQNIKEKRVATAQPCVAGKQPVGLLSPTKKTKL
jgi:hypothetical protein